MNSAVKHLFIINPKSFWHLWKLDEIISKIHTLFREKGDNNYEIHISRFPRDAVGFIPRFAKDFPAETSLRVYAVGGDGILFDCLNGVMGLKNAELAAMPYGRTNNFIRGFGKSEKTFFRNISRQVNAPAVQMDVMRCGNNYALNHCIIGLEAESVRYAERFRQKMEKGNSFKQWLSRKLYTLLYFAGVVAAHIDDRMLHQRYETEIDGENISGLFWGISAFNSPYYGGNLHPVNEAAPNDGILDFTLIRGQRFLSTYIIFPLYVSGHYKMFPGNLTVKRGQNIKLRSDAPFTISMDGALFFENEFDIELLPAAIQFVDASACGYRGVCND